jgi:hypothetical protein
MSAAATVALKVGVPLNLTIDIGATTYSWMISVSASDDGKQVVFTASSSAVLNSSGAPVLNSAGQPIAP